MVPRVPRGSEGGGRGSLPSDRARQACPHRTTLSVVFIIISAAAPPQVPLPNLEPATSNTAGSQDISLTRAFSSQHQGPHLALGTASVIMGQSSGPRALQNHVVAQEMHVGWGDKLALRQGLPGGGAAKRRGISWWWEGAMGLGAGPGGSRAPGWEVLEHRPSLPTTAL